MAASDRVAAIGPNAQQLLDNNEVRATARPGSGSAGYWDADEADRQSIRVAASRPIRTARHRPHRLTFALASCTADQN